MSWKSGKSGGQGAKSGGWSGGGTSREGPRPSWQDAGGSTSKRSRGRRQRNRWIFTTALALGLLAVLVGLWLYRQVKSDLIVLTATNYASPINVNAWASEDGAILAALNKMNLTVSDHSEQWNDVKTNVEFPPGAFQQLGHRRKAPLIVYLNVHGLVNESSEPCLLPPGASIDDTKDWVPVADVLQRIREETPQRRNVLVVLDCNRIRVNWNLGILYNTFVERVREVVGRIKLPGLAVITAAGPGEVSWASAELGASAFARYLQLGLAGAADEGGTGEGQGDGSVSVRELGEYLAREVSAWAQFNRGEPQTPQLLFGAADDFHLTWALNEGTQEELASQLREQAAVESTISPGKISGLWHEFAKLRKSDLLRIDPVAYRNFEHRLLRLEALSSGGAAYHEQAEYEFNELENDLAETARPRHAEDMNPRSLAARLACTGDAVWAKVVPAAHSLALAEYFDACRPDDVERITSLWDRLIGTGTRSARDIVDEVGTPELRELAQKLSETQLLAAIRNQDVRSLWQKVDLAEVLNRRRRAEMLAVPRDGQMPGDERAHYYSRFALQDADASRRLAEDLLFVGEKDGLEQYRKETAAADSRYQTVGEIMTQATDAFANLDRAFAETPYLAAWLCSPLAPVPTGHDDREDRLSQLLEDRAKLTAELNRFRVTDSRRLEFREEASGLAGKLDTLREEFQQEVERQSDSAARGTSDLRAIDRLLAAPLIEAGNREKLLENFTRISAELQHAYVDEKEPRDQAEAAQNANGDGSGYLESLRAWKIHPLLAILNLDDSRSAAGGSDFLKRCDQIAASVRAQLQKQIDASQFDDANSSPAKNPAVRERWKYSSAESALRASAPLGHDVPKQASQAIADLRRFDVQQLLIWHAKRAVDDCWQNVVSAPDSPPFFSRAADDFSSSAKSVRENVGLDVGDQLKELQNLLTRRQQVLLSWLQVAPEMHLSLEPQAPATASVVASPRAESIDFPGYAALYLRDGAQRLRSVQIDANAAGAGAFVTLPLSDGRTQRFELAIRDATDLKPPLDAVAYFRGREEPSRIDLPTYGGLRVDYQPHRYTDQSITLKGSQRKQSSIVFLLDCSYSMTADAIVAAGEQRKRQPKSRMKVAVDALAQMLSEIAARNRQGEGIRVGVRFFGHRSRWSNDNPRRYEQSEWASSRVAPSLDVQIIKHLGAFGETENREVQGYLANVKPWGFTPIYYSLVDALKDFEQDGVETEKSVVAITDGQDFTYEPPTEVGIPPQTTKEAVIAGYRAKSIPVHILGFNIASNETSGFIDIADKTGGQFQSARTGGELLALLRERLDIGRYEVREGGPRASSNADQGSKWESALGSPVKIKNVSAPKQFTVSFRRAPEKSVTLEGGEAILLQVAPEREIEDIWGVPYLEGEAEQLLVQGFGGDSTPYLLRVHKPIRPARSLVSFPVSIQKVPTERYWFTPRPKETWLEVTPLTRGQSAAQPYVFYDRNFEPGKPVPMVEWTALDWPDDADRARVRFWCKETATAGKSLSDVLSSGGKFGGVELLAPKPTNENGLHRVRVVENHGPQSNRVDSLRVEFQADSRVYPERVVHEFEGQNHRVTHSFYLSPEVQAAVEDPLSRIIVTMASEIKDGALQLPTESGIEISIDDAEENFSAGSTTGGR